MATSRGDLIGIPLTTLSYGCSFPTFFFIILLIKGRQVRHDERFIHVIHSRIRGRLRALEELRNPTD